MKKYADTKRKEKKFSVGQWVWAKLHHYKQQSATKRLNFKLAKRYYGPFLILNRVGPVAYKLQFPLKSKIHPVLHVSILKQYKGPIPPPTMTHEELDVTQPILPHTIVVEWIQLTNVGLKYQVLVEWETQAESKPLGRTRMSWWTCILRKPLRTRSFSTRG